MCNIARVHEQLLCLPHRKCEQPHAGAWLEGKVAVTEHAAASSNIQLLS
jgi:hypothetical protein